MTTSPALMTDQYELTMLQAAIKDGTADKRATFEVFARKLQPGFRYGVFAGLGRLLPLIRDFRFNAGQVGWMHREGIIDTDTANWLLDRRDTTLGVTVTAYREGDLYFPNSPVLTVEGTFGECVLLETLILSVLNADSAIATKAARMVMAAGRRPIIEMGSRRTNEDAAVQAARAAYLAGFAKTSNLEAGYRYGVPTTGTAAHAWTLAHESEEEAFASQIAALGHDTTLLVDTYDIKTGIDNAMDAAHYSASNESLGAIRIDSGDLYIESAKAREQLDAEGFNDTRIVVSGDMDEFTMTNLAGAPIDGYGVGTKLVSTPPSGFVYKLVAIETNEGGVAALSGETYMRPVAKKAKGKVSVGGKKLAHRVYRDGVIEAEQYITDKNTRAASSDPSVTVEVLNHPVMVEGSIVSYQPSLEGSRDFHRDRINSLPVSERHVWFGDFDPFLVAEHVG